MSSGNVSIYEFLTYKDVLPEKDLLEKASAIKIFEHSIGKELKAQINAAEKQYQKLGKVFESNKNEEKIPKSCAKSNLVYSKDFTSYKYHNTKEFAKRSFYSKWNDLIKCKGMLELFYVTEEIKPNNEDQEKKLRKVVINTTSKLYANLLNKYTTQYDNLSEDQKKKINVLNRLSCWFCWR